MTTVLALSACGTQSANNTSRGSDEPTAPQISGNPPGATVSVPLRIPEGVDGTGLQGRQLKVPEGFDIRAVARISKARFLAVAPGGDVLVSQPETGSIKLLRIGANGAGKVSDFATGMSKPHDMVFKTFGGTTYLYVSESNRVTRSVYQNGDTTRRSAEIVVSNLPDSSTPELKGKYAHALKNIAVSNDGKLYVSIASASNASPADDPREEVSGAKPERASIYTYDANKTNQTAASGTRFARGVRNAEGLAFAPGTNDLWIVVMNRDNVKYPFNDDWKNDGTGNDFGKHIQSFVDVYPPELIMKVKSGADYGWPFCNANPFAGMDNMPYDRDVENNASGNQLDCNTLTRVDKGMQAHSAPLGLTFWTKGPGEYRNVMTVGLHGCWNCSTYVGYKVSFFPLLEGGKLGAEKDLVSGWITDARNPGDVDCGTAGKCWGRPVDMADMPDGSLLISDDFSGTIYQLYRK